jgi:WD40 repeat protein
MGDHLGYISSLSFNPDGTRLATVDSVGAIKIWFGLPNEANNTRSNNATVDIAIELFIHRFSRIW